MSRAYTKPHKYTPEQDNWLKSNVVGVPRKITLQRFNEHFGLSISYHSFEQRLHKLGLHNGLVGGQFQKGDVPFNKGKKQTEFMTPEMIEKTARTRFKKGNKPHNTRNVGDTSIRKDYALIKLADNNWQPKQRILYKKYHPEVELTSNDVIIFADGDIDNFSKENLVKVTKRELLEMNRNGLYHKGNQEATIVGSDIAKINVKIREIKER